MHLRLALGVVLACALLAAGCKQQPGETSTTGPIRVGEYSSLTGTEAAFGQSTHEGIILAFEEINAGGGLLGGRKLELISEDDRGNQDEAVTVVKKLINRDKVVAVLGEVASSNSLAGGGVCEAAGIPMITPSSTNPAVTRGKQWVFRVCFTDDFQAAVCSKFAQKKGWKKVAVFTAADSDYSKGLSSFFKQDFQKNVGTIVADESYRKDDREFKPQLTKIKAANPDAVFLPGYYTQVGLIVKQARELGLTVPLFGGDGWDGPDPLKIAPMSNGCYFTNHYSSQEKRPEVQKFVTAYQSRYNGKVPDAMAITGYDAAHVLADAIKRAGTSDPAAIRDAIAATKNFLGASGTITIDAEHNARKPIVVLEIQDGKLLLADVIQPE